ncbi:MAG: hypothetical protein KAU50_04830, partial [Candidatus Marinimicrobia bacterium]|nr:hypothetical protein [Candidatus Neomarinimicrobiota bacterium]
MNKKILTGILVLTGLLYIGCEETLTEADDLDPVGAQTKAEQATSALENELFGFIQDIEDDNISSPADVDLTNSNSLYKEALVLNPNNSEANFGAALTNMMIFTQDQEVQDVFDAWEAFVDTGSMFVADTLGPSLGMVLPFAGNGSAFKAMDKRATATSYLNLYRLAVSNPPTLGDIQDIVRDIFLPALEYASARLDLVDDSTHFVFTVTGKMQGDAAESSVEFDMTEVYIMETGINLLYAFCNAAIAYNIGPSAYDSTAIIGFLSEGAGSFLSLRTGGADNLLQAKSSLLAAADQLDSAVYFLRAESDDQSDDLIVIQTGDLEEADLDSVLKYTGEFRDGFNDGIVFTEDFNGDDADQDLTINFGSLFTSPITDVKSLLPTYTVSVGRDTAYDWEWEDSVVTFTDSLDLPVYLGWHSFNLNYSYSADGGESFYYDSSLTIPGFIEAFNTLKDSMLATGMVEYLHVSINWNGELLAGMNYLSVEAYVNWDLR